VKEFHEHKLEQLINVEYTKIFLKLLRCVPYNKDERINIIVMKNPSIELSSVLI